MENIVGHLKGLGSMLMNKLKKYTVAIRKLLYFNEATIMHIILKQSDS